MENIINIYKEFHCVPCGQKNVKTVKIENKTKKAQVLRVKERIREGEYVNHRLRVHPEKIVAQPKQTTCLWLTYFSGVEGVTDNYYYDILYSEELVAQLNVHAQSVGPCLTPKVFKLKFFRFLDVNQTVRNLEITNTGSHDAKFYFDLDENKPKIEISQRWGVVSAGHKICLKFSFNPTEPGVFFKKIYCIVLYHEPLIFNIFAVYFPKSKLDPRNISFRYPSEVYCNFYEAYMSYEDPQISTENLTEDKWHSKGKNFDDGSEKDYVICMENCETMDTSEILRISCMSAKNKEGKEAIFLTKRYIDIGNSPEILKATSLINRSSKHCYYYEWDDDPKDIFHVTPNRGFLEGNTKVDFCVCFNPSSLDHLYYAEVDLRVYAYKEESNHNCPLNLPLTYSVRINAHSFPGDGCGWVPQCTVTPKILYFSSCVPGETVYGTFMIEHAGHLPINYCIISPKDPGFSVLPTLGHLEKEYHIFVAKFNSNCKAPGVYTEDIQIKLNGFDLNNKTIKLVASVELPKLILGCDNSVSFPTVFPESKAFNTVTVHNITNLFLSYEFQIPDDIKWVEIINPKGSLEPKSIGDIEIVFKPNFPCEYLDYIPCLISSITKPDVVEKIHLQVIGSCQYGFLVATPSIYDFGKCIYKKEKTIKVHLFNFSPVLLFFRLTAADLNFEIGDVERDIRITPDKGAVSAKGSFDIEVPDGFYRSKTSGTTALNQNFFKIISQVLELILKPMYNQMNTESIPIAITIIPHYLEVFKYDIECQNFRDDSDDSTPCEAPRKIISLSFEGVLPSLQIRDLLLINGGPLFSRNCLWHMFCVDKINEALQSLEMEQEIDVIVPEQSRHSSPLNLALAIQSNGYGEVVCDIKINVFCNCPLTSSEKLSGQECSHKKAITVHPIQLKLDALEKEILIIKINYNFKTEALGVIIFEFSDKRKVSLKFPLVSLSKEALTLSSFTKPIFNLKPVFLADFQPPVQLFWFYNNTDVPATYSVDLKSMKAATADLFDCINPEGVVQPFSPHPLGILFSPKEMLTYSVNLIMNCHGNCTENSHENCEVNRQEISLIGEGTLNVSPIKELMVGHTKPEEPIIEDEEIQLECTVSTITIPFARGFSRSKRVFFVRNKSVHEKWSFKWLSYTFPNIFSVRVEPEIGVLNPCEEGLMTLILESFCYSTSLRISIPCEVISYSQQVIHDENRLLQSLIAERDKNCFTITEKGTSYKETKIPQAPEPKSHYIQITLLANIISGLNVEQLLTQQQQNSLRAEKEIKGRMESVLNLEAPVLHSIQGLLENLLWYCSDILSSSNVVEKIKSGNESQDFIYLQLIPESLKKKEKFLRSLKTLPQTYFIQKNLECTLLELLCKNFMPDNKKKC